MRFIGKSHSTFALSQRSGQRAVGINKGLLEEILRLLIPNPLPRGLDGFHRFPKQSAWIVEKRRVEISTGGRIRNPFAPTTIQEGFIVAPNCANSISCNTPHQAGHCKPGSTRDHFRDRAVPLEQLLNRREYLLGKFTPSPTAKIEIRSSSSLTPCHVRPSENGYCWHW